MFNNSRTHGIVACCAAGMLAGASPGADLLVPSPYPTIQSAVDAAEDGDSVLVSSGTYAEAVVVSGKSIAVVGVDGAAATIVDGAGLGAPVFELVGIPGSQVGLKGLTLRNGAGKIGTLGRSGGGVYATGVDLIVEQCVFEGNLVSARGGGAYVGGGGAATWIDCTFVGNACLGGTSAAGAGVYMDYGTAPTDFAGCTFKGNVATSVSGGGVGGGAFVHQSTFTGCSFQKNTAPTILLPGGVSGGGAAVYANDTIGMSTCTFAGNEGTAVMNFGFGDTAASTFEACEFTGNVGHYGGGLFVNSIVADVNDCSFVGNIGKDGGGLNANYQAIVTVTACVFDGNSAVNGGAAAAVAVSAASFDACSFVDNSASTVGGGLVCAFAGGGAGVEVNDCEISGNDAGAGGGLWVDDEGGVGVGETLICGNSPGNVDGPWTDLGGNDVCSDGPAGDLDGNGIVDGGDVGILLAQWGTIGPEADLNNDFVVDGADLGMLLGGWG